MANCRPKNNDQIDNTASSIKLITSAAPNLMDKWFILFGCPITLIKPKEKRERYCKKSSDCGIAVGSSKGAAREATVPP